MVPSDDQILTNLRKGALEFCVLALLRDGERYGLEIAQELADAAMITSAGTIYPLLSRLRKSGMVTTTWQESTTGPPRRYYALTSDGQEALGVFEGAWVPFRTAVDAALRGHDTAHQTSEDA